MLTFFFRAGPSTAHGCVPGMVGMFAGTVSSFRGRRQLVHPECEMLPGAPPNADLTPELAAEFATELIPVYPASAKCQLLEDRQVGQDGAGHAGRGRGPAARRAAGAVRAGRPGRGDPGHPPAAGPGRPEAGHGAAEVGRGVRAAGRAGAAPDGGRRAAGHAAAAACRAGSPTSSTPGCRSRSPGPGRGGRDDRARPGLRLPHAPAAAGRGRLGQDGDRDPGDAPGGGRGRPGRAAGPDRGARPAALPLDHRHARPAGPGAASSARAEHATRVALLTGSQGAAARRAALPDAFTGDAGIVIGTHALLEEHVQFADLGPGGDRRAAQVRRGAARRAAGQGGRQPAARPGHDGDADPADGGHDRLRRPGDLDPDRAARRALADRHPRRARRGQAAVTWSGPGSGSGRRRPRAAGLRGLPAHRRRPGSGRRASDADEDDFGRRGRPAASRAAWPRPPPAAGGARRGRDAGAGPLAGLRLGILHGRLHPDEKDRVMRAFAGGRARRPGRHHGHRGRRRRAERHGDGRHGRRPVRRLPAAPAPRPGRPRERAGPVPAGHRGAAGQPGPGAARRGRRHPGRVQAVPARPGAAPGGRRPRRRAGRPPVQPEAAPAARRRGPDRPGPGGGHAPWSRPTRSWPGTPPWAPPSTNSSASRPSTWTRPSSRRSALLAHCGVHTEGMARVIAGEAGGRRLAVPDGRDTRPTSDRAREGLFAAITSIVGPLAGARVLDLYAGRARSVSRRCPGAPSTCCWSRPAPAPRAHRAEHRGDRVCPGPRSSPTGWSGCWPADRPAEPVRRGVRRPAVRAGRTRR